MTRHNWVLVLPAALLLVGATPRREDDLIRSANAAFLAGDTAEADRLYAAAEELTADPGLVAFNRAAVLFQKGEALEAEARNAAVPYQKAEFREAEAQYARVLADTACPPERATRAWYNRGTCLLRRGGTSSVYRSAIACLERVLDSAVADEPLKADARHNLELAKVLWKEAFDEESKAGKKPNRPSDAPPAEEPPPPKPAAGTEPQPNPNTVDGSKGTGTPQTSTQPIEVPNPAVQPKEGDTPAQGTASTTQPPDTEVPQPLSPKRTRELLEETARRLKIDRRNLRDALYGKRPIGDRDW